jgi:hypothetical protein
MILRILTIIAIALSSLLAVGPALAAEPEVHSGILTAIDLEHHMLTLSEMGPWKGSMTARTTQTMTISPDAKVEIVQRAKSAPAGGWAGDFRESPLAVSQLHPGQFATVKLTRRAGKPTVESIEVVSPTNG